MKRIILIIGSLLGLGGAAYWYSTKKNTTTGETTASKTPNTNTPPTPPKVTPPKVTPPKVEVPKYSDKIGLTYEGQAVYKKWNGVAVSGTFIGYLADGTLLSTSNAVYENGEYKRKTPIDSTVNLSLVIGMLNVDGTNQRVFGQKTGVNLMDYFGAVGFLDSGLMVFYETRNAGQTDEYSYYHT